MIATTSLQCPKIEHQLSVHDFRPCILNHQAVVRPHESIIEPLASFQGKTPFRQHCNHSLK